MSSGFSQASGSGLPLTLVLETPGLPTGLPASVSRSPRESHRGQIRCAPQLREQEVSQSPSQPTISSLSQLQETGRFKKSLSIWPAEICLMK